MNQCVGIRSFTDLVGPRTSNANVESSQFIDKPHTRTYTHKFLDISRWENCHFMLTTERFVYWHLNQNVATWPGFCWILYEYIITSCMKCVQNVMTNISTSYLSSFTLLTRTWRHTLSIVLKKVFSSLMVGFRSYIENHSQSNYVRNY